MKIPIKAKKKSIEHKRNRAYDRQLLAMVRLNNPLNRRFVVGKMLAFLIVLIFFIANSAYTPASAREIVAKIYGQSIYRDELQGPNKNLGSLLISPLFEHFVAENHIVVTELEIHEFMVAMNETSSSTVSQEQSGIMHDIAKSFVLNWKISRALYKKYGGDVIFQQANPLEPIGAERQFLEEQEKVGAFQILDTEERKKFFEYYVQPHTTFIIPPSQVNYEQPWWQQK
jgi:hypothetical protein